MKKLLLPLILGLFIGLSSCNKATTEKDKAEDEKPKVKDPKDMTLAEISKIVRNSTWEWVYNTRPFPTKYEEISKEGKKVFKSILLPFMTKFLGYPIDESNYDKNIMLLVKAYKKVIDGDKKVLEKFKAIGGRPSESDYIEFVGKNYFKNFKDLIAYARDEISFDKSDYVVDNVTVKNHMQEKLELRLNDKKDGYILFENYLRKANTYSREYFTLRCESLAVQKK